MSRNARLFWIIFIGIAMLVGSSAPASPPELSADHTYDRPTGFHLASRPWVSLDITPKEMLDVIEGLCRFMAPLQNQQGAIIDPYLHREFQYSTPYFAFAVGTLVKSGRARDLLPNGIAAMESATRQMALGRQEIPDGHGEFFLASVTEAIPIYRNLVPRTQWDTWRARLRLPVQQIIMGLNNNWQTYAMKGEWQRARLNLVSHGEAVQFIERSWREQQRGRLAVGPYHIYHDGSSDPDTLSVALVGENNLLAMLRAGYNGPSASEIRHDVETALRTTLLLEDPTGQVPANGRTDDHVWTDIGMLLGFETMAWQAQQHGDLREAGMFRRSANLAFSSIDRWRREDGRWAGSYYITKNHFDPTLRVGYQTATQYSNYTGSLMFHLSEAYLLRKEETASIKEQPVPAELGGYAIELDPRFASAFANAGGTQIQVNLRGETEISRCNWWTPLGLVRIARAGWNTRLGPSDGAQTAMAAVSFAPEILRDGRWTRLAEMPKGYEATWSVQMVNPAIVRCALEYHPIAGYHGPSFRNRFIIIPDGILSTVERVSPDSAVWGVTWPLLIDDGRPLQVHTAPRIAETSFVGSADTESFLAVDKDSTLDASGTPVRSSYGDLLPIRMRSAGGEASNTFVYPHDGSQPDAKNVLNSFHLTASGFHSILGRVDGDVYVGRNFAGGRAKDVDLDGDGIPDLRFDHECGFVLQIRDGTVTAIEADQFVTARLQGHIYHLSAYVPETVSR
jgi:hypothetical protein